MKNKTQIWLENVIYALIWLVVFIVPIFGFNTSTGVKWTFVYGFWINILPFLALFTINNYILISFFLIRKRYLAYTLSLLALIGLLFTVLPLMSGKYKHDFPRSMIRHDSVMSGKMPDFPGPGYFPHRDSIPFEAPQDDTLFRGKVVGPHFRDKPAAPPHMFMPVRWGPMLSDWLMAILLIGFNAAIGLMFRSISDARRMEEFERRNLRSELDHLKAQVNPHFLMNTLNNIHALIDTDNGKAKITVIELSKIMRYMLYESDKQFVPLRSEVEFLRNYTSLMRIRYTDDVAIETSYPDPETENILIPPLLLITLLENAFKHGISGGSGSYISAILSVTGKSIVYAVRNSIVPGRPDDPGLGLENLRKRLGLLYGDRYTLEITASSGEYAAKLTIPTEYENEMYRP